MELEDKLDNINNDFSLSKTTSEQNIKHKNIYEDEFTNVKASKSSFN